MSASDPLILPALTARVAEAVLFASVLLYYHRIYRRKPFLLWGWSWVAYGIHGLAGVAALVLAAQGLPVSSPAALLASAVGGIAALWHAAFLLAGTGELATGRDTAPRLLRTVLALLVVAGVTLTLLWAWSGPAARDLRLFTREGVPSLMVGLALLATAVALAPGSWSRRHRGAGLTIGGLGALGLARLLQAALAASRVGSGGRSVPYEAYLGFFDEAVHVFLGVGMLVWLLEEERGRASEAGATADYLARYDPDTGLPNRRGFVEKATERLSETSEAGECAVTIVALERLRAIREALGEDTGRRLLNLVAGRFQTFLKEGELLGRLGDDRLGVLFFGLSDRAKLQARVDRLLAAQERPLHVGGEDFFLQLKAGSALAEDRRLPSGTLVLNATAALHVSQALAGQRHTVYSPRLRSEFGSGLELENRLRKAWADREFRLFYQPTIRLDGRKIVGLEALVRWQHPERGIVPPGDFLPAANSAGIFEELEYWVLDESLRQAKAWQGQGLDGLRMAVNFSAERFHSSGIVTTIGRLVESHGFDASLLDLEVTETAALSMAQETFDVLAQLEKMGVHIGIDDFGAGYSSFSYLGFLPASTLKIDRSLIAGITESERNRSIAAAILAVARELGLSVVAEGIEEEGEATLLTEMGCQLGQGFLFSEPRSAIDTFALLSASRADPSGLSLQG